MFKYYKIMCQLNIVICSSIMKSCLKQRMAVFLYLKKMELSFNFGCTIHFILLSLLELPDMCSCDATQHLSLYVCLFVCLFVCFSVPNFSCIVEEVIEVDELNKGNISAPAGK